MNIKHILCGLVSGLLVSLRGVGVATVLLMCLALPGMTPTTVAATSGPWTAWSPALPTGSFDMGRCKHLTVGDAAE